MATSDDLTFATQLTAAVVVTDGPVSKGDLLLFDSSIGMWKKATAANRTATGVRASAIALSEGAAVGVTSYAVQYKDGGLASASVSDLAPGTESWVRSSASGRCERVATPSYSDDLVGRCHVNGRVNLMFGTLTASLVAREAVYREYDPRDYGAELDGVTDDIAAFEAMHAALPTTGAVVRMGGIAWLSRTWRVSKRITMTGFGAEHSLNFESGFFVAPGYTALQLDGSVISADGNDSTKSIIADVALKSRILVHDSANGAANNRGILPWGAAQAISVGDCRTKSGGADPTYMFRATSVTANSGKGPATTTGAQPSWSLTAGATLIDANGITWTTERIPAVHATTTAYAVGDRVFAPADNRYYFECTVAGTSAGSRPAQLVGGNSAAGMTLDGTFTDGTITWRIKCASGFRVHSGFVAVKDVRVVNFSGYAVTVVGGVGHVAGGDTNANYFTSDFVFAEYCGGGFHLAGDDCNGWRVSDYKALNIGVYHPNPNTVVAAGYAGLGGHHIHDVSLASGEISSCYGELNSGRMILKNGGGRLVVLSTFEEVNDKSLFSSGSTTIVGGTVRAEESSSGVVVIDGANFTGRGLLERDVTASVPVTVRLLRRDTHGAFEFGAPEGSDNGSFSLRYAYAVPTGVWGLTHGDQQLNTAYLLYTAAAGLGYGPGWFGIPQGYLLGRSDTDTPVFRGRMSAISASKLRNGERKKGDAFESQTDLITLLGDGYRGVSWTANTAVTASSSTYGIPATIVEPTANTGKPGEQVWKCTTSGTTHATTEPTWPGSPTPGVTTQSDGTATWTFLGYRPARVIEQRAEKSRGPHYRAKDITTTTASANQVLDDGGALNGEDLALPESSMCIVSHTITMKKTGTANGGDIVIRSTWVRNGSGAPTEIGTGSTAPTYNLSGATLDGSTVRHAANGNRIELQCTPETAETLYWGVFRTQLERVDG